MSNSNGSNVYFGMARSGLVKIGFSRHLSERIDTLTRQYGPIELLRVVPGGRWTEAWYHRRFAAYRMFSEFFSYHESMLDAVAPSEPERPIRAHRSTLTRESILDAAMFLNLCEDKRLTRLVRNLADQFPSSREMAS